MGIAALGFCSFEGTHCTQVVTQRNATPPLLGDFGKSSVIIQKYKSATQVKLHTVPDPWQIILLLWHAANG